MDAAKKKKLVDFAGVALVAVLAGVGVWMAMDDGEELKKPEPQQEKRKAEIPAPDAQTGGAGEIEPVDEQTAPAVAAPLPVPVKPPKKITPRSASTGRVMTLMDGTVVTNTPRVFFKRDFERALLAASHPGSMSGGLIASLRARYTDEEIIAMLKEELLPQEGDDETTAGVKNRVQDLKNAALEALEAGASVDEILGELRGYNASLNLMKARAYRLRQEAIATGDAELVREAVKKINEELQAEGLRPISVPVQFREEETGAEELQ